MDDGWVIMDMFGPDLKIHYSIDEAEPETGYPTTVHLYDVERRITDSRGTEHWIKIDPCTIEGYDEALVCEHILDDS